MVKVTKKSRFQHIHRRVPFTPLNDDTPFYYLFRFENKTRIWISISALVLKGYKFLYGSTFFFHFHLPYHYIVWMTAVCHYILFMLNKYTVYLSFIAFSPVFPDNKKMKTEHLFTFGLVRQPISLLEVLPEKNKVDPHFT